LGLFGREAAIRRRVEAVRAARRNQGHELSPLQEAIVIAVASWEPRGEPASAKTLARVKDDIARDGRWSEQEEWRISTWFDSEIITKDVGGHAWFKTTVTCDGQTLSCESPSVERAYGFMRLYQQLIIDQFYSIGPPWADKPIFETRNRP